jgi:hypothetical protein
MSNTLAVLTVGTMLEDGMVARGIGLLFYVIDMLDPRSAVIVHPPMLGHVFSSYACVHLVVPWTCTVQ